MRPFVRLLIYCAAAIFLWLADSLLLAFGQGLSYPDALWRFVPATRLLLRLGITLLLLFIGVLRFTAHAVRKREIIRINKADSGAWFGRADSAKKAERLLYHSLRLATVLRMRPREKDKLRQLCYCYDIGMVGVPDWVLEKDGGLTHDEQLLRDRHIELGAEIARQIPQLRRIAPLIACHEEYYNGGGAKGMYGRSIPLACRIFLVALIYDYYTQPHEDGRVLENEEALDELAFYSGTVLDPDVFAAFRRLMSDKRLGAAVAEHVFAPE